MKAKTWRENQEEIAFIILIYFYMEKIFAFETFFAIFLAACDIYVGLGHTGE